MPIYTVWILNTSNNATLSGFELYSRWVLLVTDVFLWSAKHEKSGLNYIASPADILRRASRVRSPQGTRDASLRIGSLSTDVFERRTSSGSEPFPLIISLDATVFILPSVLILTETIWPKICSKSRLKSAKLPFPVDVRRSKTSLLKLPNVCGGGYKLYCGGW